eukprot:13103234-Heterocapsa_arctica.AAC.1
MGMASGHDVPTQEEEVNQGRTQEEGSEPEREEEDDFEEMIAGWLEFFQELNSLPHLYIPALVDN